MRDFLLILVNISEINRNKLYMLSIPLLQSHKFLNILESAPSAEVRKVSAGALLSAKGDIFL